MAYSDFCAATRSRFIWRPHLPPLQGELFILRVPRVETLYLFSVLSQSFSYSSSFVLDHTVPYGTALLGGVFPGTSCQATIAPSLRDNSQQAFARCCCEISASASRRTTPIVAWHEVPGQAS